MRIREAGRALNSFIQAFTFHLHPFVHLFEPGALFVLFTSILLDLYPFPSYLLHDMFQSKSLLALIAVVSYVSAAPSPLRVEKRISQTISDSTTAWVAACVSYQVNQQAK